jgi:hypothetical protein
LALKVTALERAARLLAAGERDQWIEAALEQAHHPLARRATGLLRRGERRKARAVLEQALHAPAGR